MKEYTNEELLKIFENDFRYSKKNNSEKSLTLYLKNINYLLEFLNNKPIFEITEDDIYDYLDTIKELSHNTYNTRVIAFRSLFNVLRKNREIKKNFRVINVAEDIETYEVKSYLKNPLSQIEQQMLIKYAKNKREVAMLKVMLSCGLRIHELIALTLNQYKNRTDDNIIILTTTKGSKQRYMILNEECINAIEDYLPNRKEGSDKLFVSNQGNQIDRANMSRTIKCIAKRSGYFSDERIKELNNHLFRHTAGYDLLNEKGKPLDVVQSLLGHASPKTTQIYANTDLKRIKEAMA